jgi:hypothetical protein
MLSVGYAIRTASIDTYNDYQDAIAVVQRNFPFLSHVSPDNLIFRAEIPGHTEAGIAEISRDTWNIAFQSVNSVMIELRIEPGMMFR